jgi:hypothetical protein
MTEGRLKVQRFPMNSSTIATEGYDSATMILEVEFLNGNVYQYFDVPEAVYQEFKQAPSPGQFFNANIRGAYRYARI